MQRAENETRQNSYPKIKYKKNPTIGYCKRTVKPTTGRNWNDDISSVRSYVGPKNQENPEKNIVQGK